MSKGSQAVKDWRRRTKERMTAAMGGRCAICGYCRSQNALEFHHLDPSQKDFSFGSIRRNPKSWPSIVEELRKCILLCANCHREVHEGLTEIPDEFPRFDEAFADYKAVERAILEADRYDDCPVCGSRKPVVQVTCSPSCAGQNRFKLDWSKLIEMKQTMTNGQIAKVVGCSEAAVRKRFKKIAN